MTRISALWRLDGFLDRDKQLSADQRLLLVTWILELQDDPPPARRHARHPSRLSPPDRCRNRMTADPLRATIAARRLGIPTRDLLRLVQDRQIRFVMVDGIAHVPEDAIAEYEARTAW